MRFGPKGTSTKYDQVLDQYFPQRSGDLLYQLVENQTDTLLLAVLYELQRMNEGRDPNFPTDDRPEQQEPDYFTTEQPLPVTSVNESEHSLNWGFPAKSVTLWGFDEPIYVSFRGSGDHRRIPLEPQDAPFQVGPEGGLGASGVQLRKPSDDGGDTQVKILALE